MKRQDTSADLIAAFLAKGGAVTKCETGASNGFTAREWRKAVTGESAPLASRDVMAARETEARDLAHHDAFMAARYAGLDHQSAQREADEASRA